MNRHPEAESNGKADANGKGQQPSQPRQLRSSQLSRWLSSLLPLLVFCLSVGLVSAILTPGIKLRFSPMAASRTEAFRWAVNRAMSAAELTQTAASHEEWLRVVSWWKEAIDLMKNVPATHPNHQIAQAKVLEYERNLKYAQSKATAESKASAQTEQPPSAEGLWMRGSRRAEVVKIQGEPNQTDRYDSMCKEVLHYGRSTVELSNGMVAQYEDFDRNLKVAADNAEVAPPSGDSYSWTLGSTKKEVFQIQGTPSRILDYDYSNKELLYYGSSLVEFTDDRVTGYNDIGGNLKVHITPLPTPDSANRSYWTLESTRDDIFRVQGTPTQVVLDSSACSEVLYYGDSTVELENGFIAGYDNLANNLRIRVE